MGTVITRVFSDDAGETHLATVQSVSLANVPTTSMTLSADVVGRADDGLRTAPRRQFAIVLQGEFELAASSGQTLRGGAGDILFLEDVEGRGHRFQRVGDQLLTMVALGVADDWVCPDA